MNNIKFKITHKKDILDGVVIISDNNMLVSIDHSKYNGFKRVIIDSLGISNELVLSAVAKIFYDTIMPKALNNKFSICLVDENNSVIIEETFAFNKKASVEYINCAKIKIDNKDFLFEDQKVNVKKVNGDIFETNLFSLVSSSDIVKHTLNYGINFTDEFFTTIMKLNKIPYSGNKKNFIYEVLNKAIKNFDIKSLFNKYFSFYVVYNDNGFLNISFAKPKEKGLKSLHINQFR